MAVSHMCNTSSHNYWNSSVIVDLAIGQVPRSTEHISSRYDTDSSTEMFQHIAYCYY